MFLGLFLYNDISLLTKLLIVIIITYLFMRITKKHLLCFILLGFFSLAQIILFHPTTVSAQVSSGSGLVGSQEGLTDIGRVYGDSGSGPQDIRAIVARIINVVLGFLGVIFLGLAVVAGFQYMTAAGNEEQTKKALSLLRNAIIGIVIILVSWGITRFTLLITGRTVSNKVDYTTYRSLSN